MIGKFVAILVLGIFASASVNAAVPDSLSDVLAENNCRDVSEDPKVKRFEDPWWVSLEPLTGGEADYALYCQANGEDVLATLILVIRGDSNPWRECSPLVNSWRGERRLPFRYSLKIIDVVRERSEDLSRWWLVSSSRNPTVTYGAEGEKVSGPIIDTGTPAGTWYACHSGEWYRMGVD